MSVATDIRREERMDEQFLAAKQEECEFLRDIHRRLERPTTWNEIVLVDRDIHERMTRLNQTYGV